METLAREKYVFLVTSMGASSVKVVQTGELGFAAILTYAIAKRPQRQHNSVLLRSGHKLLRKCP